MQVELYNLFAALMKLKNEFGWGLSFVLTQLKTFNSTILTLKITANLPLSVSRGQHYMYSSVDYGDRNRAPDLPSSITPVVAFNFV